MYLSNAHSFDLLVKDSPQLQARIEQMRSPIELIDLARAEGMELTMEDMREIAQAAIGIKIGTNKRSTKL